VLDALEQERNWSPATRTCALVVLSGFWGWCVKKGLAEVNICRYIPRVTGRALNNTRKRVLTSRELKNILHHLLLAPCVRDAVLMALHTGLRLGSITSLTPEHVHEDAHGLFVEVLTKNKTETRCYLYGEARAIVERRKSASEKYIFSGPKGGVLRQKYIRKHLEAACRCAGVEYGSSKWGFTFHSLRRCFATYLLEAGEDPGKVRKAGGWLSEQAFARYDQEHKQRRRTLKNSRISQLSLSSKVRFRFILEYLPRQREQAPAPRAPVDR
jgi:integrase